MAHVASLQRPLASGMTAVGAVLLVLGLGQGLIALELVPEPLGAWAASWWPLTVVIAGLWLMAVGRRAMGLVLVLLGAVLLLLTAVPDGFVVPVLLIAVGALLLSGTVGERRWLTGRPAIAVFGDLDAGEMAGSEPSRSFVAVFGKATGRLDPAEVDTGEQGDGPVECLAVFGDVEVEVPQDVAVELIQTAVFGDVRAPTPPTGAVTASITVRATAVFGDVELRRR
ncbi:MAG: hypothetical protein ACLFRD_01420 [Nitriliruptoraceae bacterium]